MLMLCAWLVAGAQAGTPARTSAPAPAPPTAAAPAAAASDYRIGPGDILRITVYGHDDLSQTVVVQPAGGFVYPLIGAVDATEATPQEVEARIVAHLAKGLIRDPRVTVVVQEFRSKVIYVVGEIARPGAYPLTGRTTVVEILAKAGPLSPLAGSEVVVVRPVAGGTDRPLLPSEVKPAAAEVLKVDVSAIQAGRLERNLLLAPNDTVFVPQAERIFVTGEVRNPGAFAYSTGLTVRQAVSLAGGFSEDAATGGARVVRTNAGHVRTLKMKLDEPIRPGDTILIKAKLF